MSRIVSKSELLKALLAYPQREQVPFDKLVEKFNVPRTMLMGLTSALVKGSPKTLAELEKLGYTMDELPAWVGSNMRAAQSQQAPQPDGGSEENKVPTRPPTAGERGKQLQEELQKRNIQTGEDRTHLPLGADDLSSAPPSSGFGPLPGSLIGSPTGSPTGSPLAMGAALQLMNQKEAGSTVEFEGRRYRVSRTNGELKLTPVEQSTVATDPAMAAAMSKAIADSIEVNMLAVAKKVALSPVVVIGHGMVTTMKDEEGTPYFVGDIGDFINWACDFTLRTAFGIRIGVITGAPSLMSAMKTLKNQSVEMRNIV